MTTTTDRLVGELRRAWAGYRASGLSGLRQQVLDRLSALGVRIDGAQWTDEALSAYLADHWGCEQQSPASAAADAVAQLLRDAGGRGVTRRDIEAWTAFTGYAGQGEAAVRTLLDEGTAAYYGGLYFWADDCPDAICLD